jgi:pyruvate ferredoxin oxidoreductase alpha subunit
MANANRALSAPINIHCDHSDVMGARDAGWIMLFAETAQEAYDNTIVALRVAEHEDCLLPAMSCLDGFITTHSIDRVSILDDASVADFVGERIAKMHLLDDGNPVTFGAFSGLGGPYMEMKKAQRTAMERARGVIKRIAGEYRELSGRPFDVIETWGMEDAEVAVVVMGSAAGNFRHVAKVLQANGDKVGVVKVRSFRPFPYAELADALSGVSAVAVMDRADAMGAQGGPLYLETVSALYDSSARPAVVDYVYGLGGADLNTDLVETVFKDLKGIASGTLDPGRLVYLGAR